ncbi:MAG: ABC-2 transporter permease [Lachnospiraceae bacterium]|nr:ABC-2 transporter permease [Lachnospiraceae bacterium]
MKAIHFTKIDFIKTKQQMWFAPIIMLIVTVIMVINGSSGERAYNAATLFFYPVFIAIVFSTIPFGACRREDAGFMLMLPATTRDRVVGRFLYGIIMLLLAAAIGEICIAGYMVLGYRLRPMDLFVCLIGFSVALLLVVVEYVFLYLFGENQGPQMLSLVRMIPGMCYFFVGLNISSKLMEEPGAVADAVATLIDHLMSISIAGVAVSIIVLVAAIELCVRVTEKKDC